MSFNLTLPAATNLVVILQYFHDFHKKTNTWQKLHVYFGAVLSVNILRLSVNMLIFGSVLLL